MQRLQNHFTDLLGDPKKKRGKGKVQQDVPVNRPKFIWGEDQQKSI